MKKKVKLLIALVLIAVIAFGVYFIFGQGTDNKQIRAKAYALQNEIVVDEENIFEKTNNTINEMLALINAKGYDAGDEKTYFETYCEVLAYYNLVNKAILQNGLYVTNFNTGKSFNNMNSDYSKLVNV
ncbi:MAG: hypothetical protein IJW25_02605, partial [Clostridia bacterium]|nr:hypothetical protein [Clostridia bacterium]